MTSKHGPAPFSLSLADFIQQSRLDSPRSSKRYVIGNQAGDADSIVSALTLAYIDSMAAAVTQAVVSPALLDWNTPVPVVPIVSVARKDFKFRQETVRLLEWAGVTNGEDHFHFIDQVVLHSNIDNNHDESMVILVDHNRLDAALEARQWKVVEILDHHLDEGCYQEVVTGSRRNVAYQDTTALVASTCTLVTERLLSYREQLPPPYPADLAMALLGVIVLDTLNMSPDAGKGTPRDQQAIDTLLEQTDWTSLSNHHQSFQRILSRNDERIRPDLAQLFELLQSAKFDPTFWKSLSSLDALRLDYKQFTSVGNRPQVFGVSTVLMPMNDFILKGDLWQTIPSYMEQQSIVVLGVMTASTKQDGNLERELLLCSFQQDAGLLDSLASFLVNSSSLALDEVPVLASASDEQPLKKASLVQIRRFRQGNAKASRKQVVPFMLQGLAVTGGHSMI